MESKYPSAVEKALVLNRSAGTACIRFDMPIDPLANTNECRSLSSLLEDGGSTWDEYLVAPKVDEQLPKLPGLYMFVWRPDLRLSVAFSRAPGQTSLRGSGQSKLQISPLVLYVGKAGDDSESTIQKRFVGEYRAIIESADPDIHWNTRTEEKERRDRLRRILAVSPLYIWCMPFQNTEKLARLESALIRTLNPPANTTGKPKLIEISRGPAF